MGCSVGVVIWVMVKDYQISWMLKLLKLFFEEHCSGTGHCIGNVVLVCAFLKNRPMKGTIYEYKQSARIVTESRQ